MAEKSTPIDRAKKRLTRMVTQMQKTHEIGRECMEFVAGDQWDQSEAESRKLTKRPMITINRLSPFVNQVVNKNAMERARIRAVPFEDADVDTAKVVNGLIRHIQNNNKSDAGEAYSNAFFCLGSAGFGYFRVDTEYCDEMDMNQEILIKKIDDPFSVYLDPDGDFAILIDFIDKESFEDEYGEGKEGGDWDVSAEVSRPSDEEVMRVEYWERTWEKAEIYQVRIFQQDITVQEQVTDLDQAISAATQPQTTVIPEQVKIVTKKELDDIPEEMYEVLKKRTTRIPTVKQYIFSGDEELEVNDWAGKYIPIIGCFAREHTLKNGEKFYKAIVKDALAPQKMYNFYKSQDAELMQQAPKSTWQGAAGSFDGFERDYDEANQVATARLQYNPVVVNGVMAPPPQRIPAPMPSQGYYTNMSQAAEEVKACIGLFDPSLGAQGNEVAARAILARQKQGDISTYHFTTSFNSALFRCGMILIDLIPHIYDTARTIRILGDDMADEVVRINEAYIDKEGKPRNYNFGVGKYDIKIDIGASSLTRRMDAAENLLEFARVVPKAGELGADMIVSNLDFEKSEELAMRLRAAQDPNLLARADMLQNGMSPQQIQIMQMQKQLQQFSGMIQGLSQENKQLKQKITGTKIQEAQIDAGASIQREKIKAGAGIEQELIRQRFKPTMPPAAVPGGIRQ